MLLKDIPPNIIIGAITMIAVTAAVVVVLYLRDCEKKDDGEDLEY